MSQTLPKNQLPPLPQFTEADAAAAHARSLSDEKRDLAVALKRKRPGDWAVVARPERGRDRSTVLVSKGGAWEPALMAYYGDHRIRAQGYAQTFNAKGTK